MKQPSMTALVSTFARAYHAAHSTTPIFNDTLAKALLYPGEYQMIAQHMLQGRAFFNIPSEGERRCAASWTSIYPQHCWAVPLTPKAR